LLISLLTVGLSFACSVDVWVGELEVPVLVVVEVCVELVVLVVVVPALGLVAVPVAGVVAPAAVVGVVVAVEGIVAVVGVAAAAVVTVVVITGAEPVPPARSTRAAASTPSASTSTTASAVTGVFQLGDGARRVRAAEPQRRHQLCSGCRGAPQMGHGSLPGAGVADVVAGAPPLFGGEVVTLTTQSPEG
jgi:hypothetical protein